MKSSCVLLASCLAGAYAADMFQITIKTGVDEFVGLLANLDEVERTFRTSRDRRIGTGCLMGHGETLIVVNRFR